MREYILLNYKLSVSECVRYILLNYKLSVSATLCELQGVLVSYLCELSANFHRSLGGEAKRSEIWSQPIVRLRVLLSPL